MKVKRIGMWALIVGGVAASYTACSPFYTVDSVNNISAANTNLNSSNLPADQNNNSNQTGNSPMPTPMPNTGGNSTAPLGCPNMPSGATVVLDTPFDTADGEGQLWEIYPGAGKITQPSGVLKSAPNAVTSILSAGQVTGGQQTIWPKIGKEQPLNNLYMCLRFKMGSNFVGIKTANKLFFIASQDFSFGKRSENGYFGLSHRGTYPPSNFQFYFGHNTGSLDNSHTCDLELGLFCAPNVKDTPLVPDVWYTVEAYMISSTCHTCRNGTVKWWINGELNGNYTNMNYGDGIVNEWQLNHTWDGSTAVQCGAPTNPSNEKGRDCTKDQIYYFDHVTLAALGGRAPASK